MSNCLTNEIESYLNEYSLTIVEIIGSAQGQMCHATQKPQSAAYDFCIKRFSKMGQGYFSALQFKAINCPRAMKYPELVQIAFEKVWRQLK